MLALRKTIRVDEPGLYRMPDADYRADPCPEPSLTQSTASVLLSHSPLHAWHGHPRLNPQEEVVEDGSRAMDKGSVAHALLFGEGKAFDVIEASGYTTKAAREARDAARAAGRVPILVGDYLVAEDMTDAARAQLAEIPGCETLFQPEHGAAEVVVAWRDEAGPWCRGLIDWLSHDLLTVVDYKTTAISVRPASLARHFYGSDWHLQAAFYDRGLGHVDPENIGRRRSLYVVQETAEPYLLSVVQADGAGMVLGHKAAGAAIGIWRHCLATGQWPGYPRAISRLEPPPYLESAWLARELDDPLLDAGAQAALPPAPLSNDLTEIA